MENYESDKPLTVSRKTLWAADVICVGDQIEIGQYTATCQKTSKEGAVFLLDQYLDKAMPMNNECSNEGGYAESVLRKWLNSDEVLGIFAEYADRMKPFENGDLLRLPWAGELFGKLPGSYKIEPDGFKQWPLMKQRKNRIAFRLDDYEWGWLANRSVRSAANFALVGNGGLANDNGASNALGVRPVFLLI